MTQENEFSEDRIESTEALENSGMNPYPDLGDVDPSSVSEFTDSYEDEISESDDIQETWVLSGRITRENEFGDFVFYDIDDRDDDVQVMCSVDDRSDFETEDYDLLENVNIGDRVVFEGTPGVSNTGELTLYAEDWVMAASSLRDTADSWNQLSEQNRIEERTAAITTDDDLYDTINMRFETHQAVREYLVQDGFQEVQTPILHNQAGGAEATPFATHCQALDREVYLRIAPELYLKRLVTAGYGRVFELSRCFRNEDIDTTHNPEFTMMELYQEYADYEDMMQLTERLIAHVAQEVAGGSQIEYDGQTVDLSPPWQRVSFDHLITEALEVESVDDLNYAQVEDYLLENHGLDQPDLEGIEELDGLLMEVFEEEIEPELEGPVFVTDYPRSSTPLCQAHPEDESRVQRFEAFVLGMEMGNSYTELTDPREQRQRLIDQVGDEDDINDEFVNALAYGMPPTAGLGIGIDRLAMLITDSQSIKEIIAYPMANQRV